jgi:hypothetical protein
LLEVGVAQGRARRPACLRLIEGWLSGRRERAEGLVCVYVCAEACGGPPLALIPSEIGSNLRIFL